MIGKLLTFGIIGIISGLIYRVFVVFDINKRVYNHQPGPCHIVDGIEHGSEDIEVIESKKIAFISTGLFYMIERSSSVRGGIFLYRFEQPAGQHKAIPLSIEGDLDLSSFHPHGLSSYLSNGKLWLYVVNHDNAFKHSVEVFEFIENSSKLLHTKSIKDSSFTRPNDMVVVGKDQFFVTNDGAAQTFLMNSIESLFNMKTGSVVFYDGKKSHILISSLSSPNGIAIDSTHKHLYVASPNDESVTIYELQKGFKSAKRVSKIKLMTSVDNLFLDKTNSLWIGAHPVIKDAMDYFSKPDDRTVLAPSQVLHISPGPNLRTWKVTEPYANDGTQIAGSSVAAVYGKEMLIGSVFRTLLHCDIAHPSVL